MSLTSAELAEALAALRHDYPLDGWDYFDAGRHMLVSRDLCMSVGYPGENLASDSLRWLAAGRVANGDDVERMGRTAIEAVSACIRAGGRP